LKIKKQKNKNKNKKPNLTSKGSLWTGRCVHKQEANVKIRKNKIPSAKTGGANV